MGTQALPLSFGIKLSVFCLVLVLSSTNLASSQLNYHVESLDDTRNALLTYSSKPGANSSNTTTPSNSFLRTVDEIEKSVYNSQALRSFYTQTPARLRKIEANINLAAQQGSHQFIRQSLGHALYTTIEIEKKKSAGRRRKRCSLCADAMKKFIERIEKKIGTEKFKKFVGTPITGTNKATLMFAIDDTGSMSADIQSAKDIAEYIINYPRPNLEVDYILSPFNDPESGRAMKMETGKAGDFIRQIGNLRAHGGGDCPEMTFKGIIEALKKSPVSDSPLYVFTDAPPKDATKTNIEEVKVTAKAAGINVYFFATRRCGDPGSFKPFEDLARDTCGQVFVLPRDGSKLTKMKEVAKDLLGGTTCSGGIGSFLRKKKRSVSHSVYRLLVDDTMEKIIVSVSSENSGAEIDLIDPLGTSVTSGKTTISTVTIFEADNPKAGIWQLLVPTSAGKHTYLLKGSSKINLGFDFIFVIPRHLGSPIPISYPLKGKNAHVILIVRGADKVQASSLNLDILSTDGTSLSTTAVRAVGTSGTHFSASFPTPAVPFKMQLKGRTKKNNNFERNSQSTVNPSHVVVRVMYARNEFTVPKNGSEVIWFFIYNTGVTEEFKLKVKDTLKFQAQYSKSPIRVYPDRLASFHVDFTQNPSVVSGTAEDVLVTVTGQTSKVSASYIVSLMAG